MKRGTKNEIYRISKSISPPYPTMMRSFYLLRALSAFFFSLPAFSLIIRNKEIHGLFRAIAEQFADASVDETLHLTTEKTAHRL
jgi:hypothetical protein